MTFNCIFKTSKLFHFTLRTLWLLTNPELGGKSVAMVTSSWKQSLT